MSMTTAAPFQLVLAQDPKHKAILQKYIQEEYQREFNAVIPHFLPYILGLYRADGALIGACGLNPALSGALYLEHYLDGPVEQVASNTLNKPVSRDGLVEIGNFACAESGNARTMFAALCRLLFENQLEFVVFTGTHKLRNVFHHLHLVPVELAAALPEHIGAAAQSWGSYYLSSPSVMVGDLSQGFSILSKSSMLLSLFGPMPIIFPRPQKAML